MKFPPPLRLGIPLVLFAFGLVAGITSLMFEERQEQREIEREGSEHIRQVGTRLATMISFLMEMDLITGAQRELALAHEPDMIHGLVLDAGDKVIFSTRYDQRNRPLAASVAAQHELWIDAVRESGVGESRVSADGSKLTGLYPFPILRHGSLRQAANGIVFLEFDLSRRKAIATVGNWRRMQFGGAILAGLTLLFSLIFHRMLTSRASRLVKAAEGIASGVFSTRVRMDGVDEFAKLGAAFDRMAEQLQQRDLALLDSEQRFRQMAENVGEIFWLFDFDTMCMTYVSPAFETVFGKTFASLQQCTQIWLEAVHPADRERVEVAFGVERNGPREVEYRIVRPDETIRWLRDRSFPIQRPSQEQVRLVAGVVEDITQRKQMEEEKAQFDRKLQETQRLESLGVLAGGIAHDFNNLLTGVLGNASLARMQIAETDEAQKYLAEIEQVAMRAADLCKQMLAYSGKGRFQVQLLDISALVKETTQLLSLSIAKNAVLRFDLATGLPPVSADPTQLRQVVMNLVINASEALGGKSGSISLHTGLMRLDRDYLDRTLFADDIPVGDYVFIEVADNGCGMSAETQARIFEPFYTTKFTGRGLGLSAVLGIVRGHRGTLKVYSELGKGTMFKLLFPIAQGHAVPLGAEALAADTWRGSGTVLVVDDEETVRAVSARMLESFGFQVVLACDGREAVEAVRTQPGRFCAVLMDLTMPHMDGEEAFRRIRTLQPDACVLLMSGFNEQEAINRFTGKGLAGFLQKPFNAQYLRAKLRNLLSASAL